MRSRRPPAERTRRAVLAPESAVAPLSGLVPPWPGRMVQVGDSSLHVRHTPPRSPDAVPALYVHGLGGSATNWTDLAGLLATRFDGEAVDLPGAGLSPPADRYTIEAFAQRLARFLDESGRGPVHLLGNSLGGTVTVALAAARPDLVRSLTLVSPALPFLDPRRSLQSWVVPVLAMPRGERLLRRLMHRLPPEEFARRVMEACFADPGRVPPERFAEAVREIEQRYELAHYVPAYLRTMRGLITAFLRAYLPGSGSLWRSATRVAAPTLVIGGRQDRLVDVRVAPWTAFAVPDSRLLMLDGVGHLAQLEAPRTVARAVIAFLDELGDADPTVEN